VKLRETILRNRRRINRAEKKTIRKIRKSLMLKLKPPNERFLVKKSTKFSIYLNYKMIIK
jgi:hypothetical protein